MKDFSEKLKQLPAKPGVYLMKDKQGVIIYVGKAKILKNRVTSYFRGFNSHSPKTQTLVVNIDDFEYIITATEVEALILEANLIKKYKPRFNVMLKDDKAYPYIKITNEPYPRVLKVRAVVKDGAIYYGPYSSNYAVNQTLEVLQKGFPIRSCNRDMKKKWRKPCLNYHIKQCVGPCLGKVKQSEYAIHIEHIKVFLDGKQSQLITQLKQKMHASAEMLAFEKAAEIRNQIEAIEQLTIKQNITHVSGADQDIIGAKIFEDKACIFILFVRSGKMIGKEHFIFDDERLENTSHLIHQFILQFYSGTPYVPKELLISDSLPDADIFASWLSEKRGNKVVINVPQRGQKKALVDMAIENASDFIEKHYDSLKEKQAQQLAVQSELKNLLGLPALPKRIEAYDISNIMGSFIVASMVVYENGLKKKTDYRRFKIKTTEGPDDYKSMMEVIYRRFNRGLASQKGESVYKGFDKFPDILLIDGGVGHVNAVLSVTEALGISIPVVGMIKDDKHTTHQLYYNGQHHALNRRTPLYRFIYDVQEEVHRFAITYHRSLRDKQMIQSVLDDIDGIGTRRKTALLKHFKSIERIKRADIRALKEVDGMTEKAAKAVYDFFHLSLIKEK